MATQVVKTMSDYMKRKFGESLRLPRGTMDPRVRVCKYCGTEKSMPGDPWECPECGRSQHSLEYLAIIPAAVERARVIEYKINELVDTENQQSTEGSNHE